MPNALNPLGIGSIPGDDTGDQPRAAFTKVICDLSSIIASMARRTTTPGTFGVTSSAGSTTALNDSSRAWTVNQFAGQVLTILTGPLEGYSGTIASNTATSITVSSAFGSAIGNTIGYQVTPANPNAGSDGVSTGAGGTAPSTLVDTTQAWTVNQWAGYAVKMLDGPYAGQSIPITSNTATALTLTVALAAIPAGVPYLIGGFEIASKTKSSSLTATLATSQNNYAPAASGAQPAWGAGIDRLLLAAASGGSAITGLSSTGIPDGWEVLLRNTSATDLITLSHLSGSSSAANQFSCPGALTFDIAPLSNVRLTYLTGISKWTIG